jgi:TonB family protein
MRPNSPSAFFTSVVFHLLVLVVGVALTLWLNRAPEIQPFVFETVDVAELMEPAETPPPQITVVVPQIVAPAPSPSPPQPAPRPPPTPQPQPPPQPAPAPRPPPPAPTPTPAPEPPRTVSYEEFVRQQARQLERNQRVPEPRPVAVPRIDTTAITRDLQEFARRQTAPGTTAAQLRELDAYIARLIAALRAAHQKPDGLSELLSAKVSFHIAADGTLSNVRLTRSSGDAAFDSSVIEAFSRVRTVGPVPGRRSYTWELTFRMREG